MQVKRIIETILLAYEDSISNNDIRKSIDENLDDNKIISIIDELNQEYDRFVGW